MTPNSSAILSSKSSSPAPAPRAKPADEALESAISEAIARIAPLWPLDRFVAVNPFAGLAHLPFAEACALLGRGVGALPLQAPVDYLEAWGSGIIDPEDLASVTCDDWPAARLLQVLEEAAADSAPGALPTVADLLDQERPHAHWTRFVTDEISKWCAVRFDRNQTTWNSPWRDAGLYAGWLQAAGRDLNPEAFGLTGFRKFVASLPAESEAAIRHCMARLVPQHAGAVDFLHRQLVSIAGWAGHVKYLVREEELRGRDHPGLRDLLAIRLAYDAALFEAFGGDQSFRAAWMHQRPERHDPIRIEALVRWQDAYEAGYRRTLAAGLVAQPSQRPATRPSVQAVFCIDVRSEPLRRHLEATAPGVQTIGFAGFFGFPIEHRCGVGPDSAPRCPVLLVPPLRTCEELSEGERRGLESARATAGAWKAFQNSAASCFSFVETAGLAFGAALARMRSDRGGMDDASRAPRFAEAPRVETRAAVAGAALRNMGLTSGFARLVLLCGHGSQSANNPYASALDCGACGGHAGDVNARLAARTLNDPAVRVALTEQGIIIPHDTWFVAGLHHTATDEVTWFEADRVPPGHAADLAALRSALAAAGRATRVERAPSLGLGSCPADKLDLALRERASDMSQVRPEWGLANNAALVAAPRSRTAGLKLDGRVFLHDYDAASDPGRDVLTLILCAPVVVASWINLQYYASRVDPRRYGSGNKVLHNVAAGLGVLEGNGGDLRVGLPLQSIHDGQRFVHEPRRLAVFVEASRDAIDAVLDAHPGVRMLFDHGWIHLHALEGPECHRRTARGWTTMASAQEAPSSAT